MIELLQSGRINNRLLCEVATHDNFQQLMADIEIYVDRIASMQISNLNAIVDIARSEILSKCKPGVNDLYVRTLDVAHIHEDEYFSRMIHDDIDAIIRDIRKNHEKDIDTAPETTIVEELKRQIDDVVNFKGSNQEKQIRIFCNQLGIPYEKLSTEEFVVLIGILKKSSYIKGTSNHRGKASLRQKAGRTTSVKGKY